MRGVRAGGERSPAREGLKEATLAQVLTHLDAPELDPIERLLVPFARETIWYEPAPMQRRARRLCATASRPRSSSRRSAWRPWPMGCAGWAPWCWIPMTRNLSAPLLVLLAVAGRRSIASGGGTRPQAQLEAAAADLQHLQEACSRLRRPVWCSGSSPMACSRATETALAERKVVTALFADLVGYTAMSERLEPAVLARVLNGYFQRMSDAIHEHRGHVVHFLGDGILAYFGALQPNPWQCNDAVCAALAMRAAIREYNVELAREGLPSLAVGIGIHRGPGLAGLVARASGWSTASSDVR